MVAARRGRGFTLLEVMLVLALMFVGLLGMVSLQVVASRSGTSARQLTEATALAQDRLELLKRTGFAALGSSAEDELGPQGTPVPGGIYSRTTTVNLNGLMATIQVQVGWTGPDGRPHAVILNTLRAQ